MQRIFLVGCPRSGTTLAQSLLGSAPGMLTFTESHFFDKCFSRSDGVLERARHDRQCVSSTIDRFCSENNLPVAHFAADQTAEAAARAFIALLDRAAGDSAGWIEKTPDHLKQIPLIDAVVPDAVFVHIIRRPAGTIASLQKASRDWGKPRSWYAFALKWWLSVGASAARIGSARHHHVFYEDLVEDSRRECRRLFAELGIAWDEGVMERYRQTAAAVIAPHESWKQGNLGGIGQRPATDPELNFLQRLVLPWLERRYRMTRDHARQIT